MILIQRVYYHKYHILNYISYYSVQIFLFRSFQSIRAELPLGYELSITYQPLLKYIQSPPPIVSLEMCLKLNVPSYDFTDGLTDFNRLILISAYRLHSSGIAAPPLQPSHIDPALVLGPHHNPQELSQTPQIKKFLFCLYFWFLNKNFHFNGFRACPVVLLIPTSHISGQCLPVVIMD